MRFFADILFIIATVLMVSSVVSRHRSARPYRELLKKENKTPLEQKCVKEFERFFKLSKWNKLYLAAVVPSYFLVVMFYDSY
tara:strand:+ start:2251 stop:2496 length:246 start_codon:yes stop_codon:yes gene_type:complete